MNRKNVLHNLPNTTELLLGCELARQPKIAPCCSEIKGIDLPGFG
jgi:hypothetical protein